MSLHERLGTILPRLGLEPGGVIHVGAHEGQELELYGRLGLTRQVWIEPQREVYGRLMERLRASGALQHGARAWNVACGPERGRALMHVIENNDGMSNSLLEPALHLEAHPELPRGGSFEVEVEKLDELMVREGLSAKDFGLLVLDVQGFELGVLKGAERTLAGMMAVLSEVATRELYAGGALVAELDAFLEERGFVRAVSRIKARLGYGDALYVRRALLTGWARARVAMIGPYRR